MQRNYAYIRVSTKEQNLSRQLDAIKECGIEINERDIFIDKASGRDFNRPEYLMLKRSIRKGDLLVITSLDRLGRNKTEIMREWEWMINNGIDIMVLDMPILNTRKYGDGLDEIGELISNLVLQILTWLSQEELKNIKERQRMGIESAKKRGVKFGRPKIIPKNFEEVYHRWANGEITAVKAMELTGLKRNTFYNRVKEFKAKNIINN
ncbi:recombinase family protein [Tepidimicrobium xylanilyticum]|uniref:recombinase family protein n=1 Tax=Tepidimicrobium xylanilyticum TaxID=1123352 RepID=UPI00264BC067|nr:recombinase family protein [Tepidimicrobium xylanilyticum]GMG98149.1 DNA recombinase [Tepidimicrobium xylanilyticum]